MNVLNVPLNNAIAGHEYGDDQLGLLTGRTDGVQIKGSWTADTAVSLNHESHWLKYIYSIYPRYYIDLRVSYSSYLKKFASKSQYNLRRQRRVYFEKMGVDPAIVIARSPQEIEDFFYRARKVSELTYQERLLSSGLPSRPEFIAAMRSAALENKVHGFLLPGKDGKDSAYMYCLAVGDDLVCKYIGYDPSVADLSPGSTLLLMAIETLCADGELRYFDFEEGGAQYKKQFATGDIMCANVLVLRKGVSNSCKLRLHKLSARITHQIGRVADRLGLRSALRKMIRRRVISG